MLNQCSFIGNLGADPEIRSTQSGTRIANFRIAVTEKWKDSSGEAKERTDWIPVVVFGDGPVGVIDRYLRKGSKVFVQGQFRTRRWQDQQGNDRYSTEVVLQGPGAVLTMLDGPPQSGGDRRDDNRANDYQRPNERARGGSHAGGFVDREATPSFDADLDDEVPF